MSDGYCGACENYSYVKRYGRGDWQFGYCQNTKCIRSWERKKRRHAYKHRKDEEECASRKKRRHAYNTWKDEEECASAPPPTVQQLFLAKTAAVELKPSENPPTPPSSSYSSSDNESYDVSDKCTQTGPVFVFDVTEKYKDDYAAFIAWKQQCDKTAAPKQAPRKSAVASKPSSEAPPKSTVEELKQRAMAAMNLPKKAEMASAKKAQGSPLIPTHERKLFKELKRGRAGSPDAVATKAMDEKAKEKGTYPFTAQSWDSAYDDVEDVDKDKAVASSSRRELKRVHMSQTVIEEVSNSEGAKEKKKKKKKNKSEKESRRNSSRKDKKKFKQ